MTYGGGLGRAGDGVPERGDRLRRHVGEYLALSGGRGIVGLSLAPFEGFVGPAMPISLRIAFSAAATVVAGLMGMVRRALLGSPAQLYGWQQKTTWKLKLANAIVRDPANWWRTVQIDLGSRDGLRTNLPVLSTEGLVGRVSSVSLTRSQVVLVGDHDCRAGGANERPARAAGAAERGPEVRAAAAAGVRGSTGEVWPLNVGQVYTTLQRLERDGPGRVGRRGRGRPAEVVPHHRRRQRPSWTAGCAPRPT